MNAGSMEMLYIKKLMLGEKRTLHKFITDSTPQHPTARAPQYPTAPHSTPQKLF